MDLVHIFCFVFCFCLSDAALAHSKPTVGTLLREIVNGPDSLRATVARVLQDKQQVLTNPGVMRAVDLANRLATNSPLPESQCEQNLAKPCPDGWFPAGGTTCQAPPDYAGNCATTISFAGMPNLDKQQFAEHCKAPWPCQTDICPNGRNYSSCPQGWNDVGDGLCTTAASHSEQCANTYKFDTMTVSQKRDLAHACNFSWDCLGACDEDFMQSCPQGWVELAGICLAPATYAGPCGFKVNATTMTASQRETFGKTCGVQWPCAGSSSKVVISGATNVIASDVNGPCDAISGNILAPYSETANLRADEGITGIQPLFQTPSGPIDWNYPVQF